MLYNLTRRAADWDLLPWQGERNIPLMAYSPVEQSKLISNTRLVRFARELGATPAQVALAWLLVKDDVIVIPKAGSVAHVQENAKARDLRLTTDQLAQLDKLFPGPSRRMSLEML